MNETVQLAKANNGVLVGADPSLPDQQGWGRREMAMEPVGALMGFLQLHDVKPYQTPWGGVQNDVAKLYNVPFMGRAGTCHQTAAQELSVPFISGNAPPPTSSS
ncbi:hypothetical protein V8D89_014332 [Ganoderma adspersum]